MRRENESERIKKGLNEMTLPPEFRSKQGIQECANRYPNKYLEADRYIQGIVRSALDRGTDGHATGHLKRSELLKICKWMNKPRILHHIISNQEIEVTKKSHEAFVKETIEPLALLKGVSLSTASAIMHFAFPRDYPIISDPALRTLGIKVPSIGIKLWYAYQGNCLAWAKEYGVSLRTLDRALWQYDKER